MNTFIYVYTNTKGKEKEKIKWNKINENDKNFEIITLWRKEVAYYKWEDSWTWQ